MSNLDLKYITDKNGNRILPITHINAVRDSNGNLLSDVLATKASSSALSAKADANLVPAQAAVDNQLADKAFVNSSISTATATYRGNFNVVSDLSLTVSATHSQVSTALGTAVSTKDNNDYCFVQIPTEDATPAQIASVERYKYNGTAWEFEYALNNSGFTAALWAAVNSNITSGLVTKLNALSTNSLNNIAKLFGMDASGNFLNITLDDLKNKVNGASKTRGFFIEDTSNVLYTLEEWSNSTGKTFNAFVVLDPIKNLRISNYAVANRFLTYYSLGANYATYNVENVTSVNASTATNYLDGLVSTLRLKLLAEGNSFTTSGATYALAYKFPDNKTTGYIPAIGEAVIIINAIKGYVIDDLYKYRNVYLLFLGFFDYILYAGVSTSTFYRGSNNRSSAWCVMATAVTNVMYTFTQSYAGAESANYPGFGGKSAYVVGAYS